MAEFRMPSLGADMEAGTLVEWLKNPGDAVHRGDIVAVVETDKGAIEVEIFMDGTMGKQLVVPETKVPVGTPLAIIVGTAEEMPQAPRHEEKVPPPSAIVVPAKGIAAVTKGLRISPAARKLAVERGLSFDALTGSGPEGAIVLGDVEKALATGGQTPPAVIPRARGLDMDKMRRAIAAAMAKSKREIPHYYLATNIDVSRAQDWLTQTNTTREPDARLLMATLTLKAVALALRKYPKFNGFYDQLRGFTAADCIHIGTAIAIRGGGLISPAIHDCDKLSLDEMMVKLRDLVARAREGRLRSSELTDPTITVSSLGERGVESLYGIIYPPQVAIVGLGKVTSQPVAIGQKIEVRPVMTATLAADHRVTDGHLGSRFLNEVVALLQEPGEL
ncbi:MAG: 2-oxo acid dehydrogenase subunit E2 [Alphaproteobacteria bacterium]|nr:2-oxo acid dehydrogenase subunit E2 [Alphaproteobacteria bacterium]